MTYETAAEYNVTEIQHIFQYVAKTVPIFFPLTLVAGFVIILFGTYYTTGRNFLASFAVAGIITSIIAFVMGMIGDMLPTVAIVIAFVVSIIGVLLLLVSDR